MERRDFVKTGLAGVTATLVASGAIAQDHQHHAAKKEVVMPEPDPKLKKVAETAHDCVLVASACIAECNRVLAAGEAHMAECQEAVLSMVSVCEATAANATMRLAPAALLAQLVKVCDEFCEYCADACEKHADHYAECKNCMESCRDCAEACKEYLQSA